MSLSVAVNLIPDEDKTKINDVLKIKMEDKYSFGPPRYFIPYHITEFEEIKIPFAFAVRTLKYKRRERTIFPLTKLKFGGELRPEQKEVKTEAIAILNKTGSVILSMYCGFGKTITSINLACSIGFKTLIIVNKIVLMQQWEESIKLFCPTASVQKIKPGCVKWDCDFYIINAINTEKMGEEFFSDIGTVIVDEAHLIMAETISKSLHSLHPRYLIGLTATPYRPDGLDALLTFYFGEDKIIRSLHREHLVYKVMTGFKPTIELGANGRVNWGVVLDSQSKDVERNELIIRIITKFKQRNFLVLVKRVEQGEMLVRRLREIGEDVTSLIGSNQSFEVSSRILVGTCSKVGTGFDHPKLDTLLMAADVEEYFIQYLGRCMRTRESTPIVFDLVDDYSILTKHYNTRKKIYEQHGGTIKEIGKETFTS
jgi:superfamily II DNA or RNA helicase